MALVRHLVVQGVRPDGNSTEWSGDGSVVDEELVSHHFKLLVATDAKVWGPHANDRTIGDVSKALNDESRTGHFSEPVIIGTLGPVLRVILVGDREDSNLMALAVQLLDCRIVCVFVRNIERALQAATIGIGLFAAKDLLEDADVVGVDGSVESDGDHLRNLSGLQTSGNSSSIRGTEAIWQLALAEVTVGCPVGVLGSIF
jgi:hypothetical protein